MSIGWSDCLASAAWLASAMPTTAANPASHLLRPSRIEFLPGAAASREARLIAALAAKHGLFGVGVQPRPVHNPFTRPAPAMPIRRRG